MQILLMGLLLAILILSLAAWVVIRHAQYIINDRDEMDKRLRNISR